MSLQFKSKININKKIMNIDITFYKKIIIIIFFRIAILILFGLFIGWLIFDSLDSPIRLQSLVALVGIFVFGFLISEHPNQVKLCLKTI